EMLKGSVNKVNTIQNEADQAVQDLLVGKDQNIHQVMIAVEKANLSLQLMMQVRSKIMGAYEEIMRTQV
ncbi:MAG TPA: flagellar hook-basal body complex protein FliE, partial [Nitrospirota bacterium]|nr:flagellar hook-basal body complex protein FliE [Nitrospirota bacterium]